MLDRDDGKSDFGRGTTDCCPGTTDYRLGMTDCGPGGADYGYAHGTTGCGCGRGSMTDCGRGSATGCGHGMLDFGHGMPDFGRGTTGCGCGHSSVTDCGRGTPGFGRGTTDCDRGHGMLGCGRARGSSTSGLSCGRDAGLGSLAVACLGSFAVRGAEDCSLGHIEISGSGRGVATLFALSTACGVFLSLDLCCHRLA